MLMEHLETKVCCKEPMLDDWRSRKSSIDEKPLYIDRSAKNRSYDESRLLFQISAAATTKRGKKSANTNTVAACCHCCVTHKHTRYAKCTGLTKETRLSCRRSDLEDERMGLRYWGVHTQQRSVLGNISLPNKKDSQSTTAQS